MGYDRRRSKERAREAMAMARPRTWAATLLLLLLTVHLPAALCALLPGVELDSAWELFASGGMEELIPALELALEEAPASMILTAAGFGLLLWAWYTVLHYGYALYALRVYRGVRAGFGSLFEGFSRPVCVLASSLITGLFSLLCGAAIYGAAAVATLFLKDAVWLKGAVWLAAAVIHTIVICRYSLTPYFVLTRRTDGALSAVAASVEAMGGKAFRRWILHLSFAGWKLFLALVVLLVGLAAAVVDVLVSDAGLARLGVLIERAMGTAGATPILGELAVLLAEIAPTLLVGAAVVWAVQLPFQLWLTAYQGVCFAGFFHEAACGEPAEEAPEELPVRPLQEAPEPVETPEPELILTAAEEPVAAAAPEPAPEPAYAGVQAPAAPGEAAPTPYAPLYPESAGKLF